MKVNPFTVTGAPAWLSDHSDDGIGQLEEQGIQQLARLLSRLLEVAESEPDLYGVLPWLRSISPWELLLKRKKEARFQYVCRFPHPSHSSDLSKMPKTAATLLAFFARVSQPTAEMVEALYLSPLLRDTRTVWEILRRMAQSAGVKPLPREVVVALCASLTRGRLITLSECKPRPHPAIWTITCRRTPIRLQWPVQWPKPTQSAKPSQLGQPAQSLRSMDTWTRHRGDNTKTKGNTLLVMVREEIIHKAGIGYQQTGKVLAFRCLPDPLDRQGIGDSSDIVDTGETTECIESAMKVALYDALVFSRSRDGQYTGPIYPPALLRVQAPVPRAIREAGSVWRIQVEATKEPERREREAADRAGEECEKWEKELAGRVLDPVHYMRILDRGLERTYGYAPFLTKQRVTHHRGWLWSMLPDHDPLLNYMGLRELLPSSPAVVGDDGTIEWQGLHYRDFDEDVLRYFPKAPVMLRRSPLADAATLVYWRGSVLCYAVAEELHHEDGSYRPYRFPYPRLGE
jgi:hypothetical protein